MHMNTIENTTVYYNISIITHSMLISEIAIFIIDFIFEQNRRTYFRNRTQNISKITKSTLYTVVKYTLSTRMPPTS